MQIINAFGQLAAVDISWADGPGWVLAAFGAGLVMLLVGAATGLAR